MSVPVEEAIAALSTFSLEDDQPDLQGLAILLSSERCATSSSIEYGDVSAYRLSLAEDTKSVNQLNSLTKEGKEMASILYTYRSCVKALPQLPDSMKNSQADLYLETYQVLDSEMGRLREIQRWQSSAASKLAGDMQRFSRPERLLNGPTATHIWSMLKLLDVLVQLDHLKNAKASIPNDFTWYKRTFTQVSIQWHDTDSMREELDDLQIFLSTRWAILLNFHAEMFRISSVEDILQVLIVFCVELLELDFHFALLFPDRHMLLRVLPVLLVLASSSEKDIESLYKRVKINRLISIFKNDPVIPAFPDLHLSPAAIMKELSMYFPNFSSQTRLLTIPSPHEIGPRELQEYQRRYLVINHIETIRSEHNDFVIRFATATNQIILLKSADDVDLEWSKEVKGCMYDMVVEGFQLLSRWTSRVWEQSAWKFSRPCKDAPTSEDNQTPVFDYEKVVRWNYSSEEREALLEVIGYIKSVGSMMQKRDTLVADALWETIHIEVQDFVQDKLDAMLRTSFRKKKDLSRILSDMRTISADWIAGTCKYEADHSQQNENEASKTNTLYPRSVPPTAAQVHCLQFLICELVTGGNLRKHGGLFGNSSSGIPNDDLKQLETFFNKLSFFLHILDYSATLITLTDLGFLWFREFYLESSRVIQFPIECSLPWMLMHHVIESQDAGLFESVLMPFDIYNDSAQHALTVLKQRFLYDEIEAEVDLCFDQLVFMISESIFSHYKSRAASEMLDKYFLSSSEKYSIRPIRFKELLKMRRVQILGRTIDLRSLITQRMNKLIRDNVDALFEHFENQDLCAIVELHKLLDILSLTHQLLSENLQLDSFHLILNEMQENLSLVSFSSRLSSQIWSELQNDFLPNFILCNTTQRFVRSTRVAQKSAKSISLPGGKSYFHCGSQDLTMAHNSMTELYSEFFGIPHMLAIVKILGPRSLPWLIRSLLDLISEKITVLVSKISGLQEALPKAIGLLSFDGGITGCQKYVHDQLTWASKTELKKEVLQGMKELGSILYLMSLLDIVLREVEMEQFMQTAPWLGFVTGNDGQLKQCANSGDSPLVNLFKSATSVVISNHRCLSPASFFAMSKQAEAADLFYKTNMQSGSVLEYAFAFTSAVLEKNYSKWSAQPRTGFVDITTTKDFYRIYSGLMFEYMEEICQDPSKDSIGDSAAWGACTIIYLLGQQLQFELFDFSHQLLNVAESEENSALQAVSSDRNRGANYLQAGHDNLFEAMKKSRRLNNYVFSVLKARCPLEEKIACAIRQSGAPVHRIRFVNAVSSFETLPQKKGA